MAQVIADRRDVDFVLHEQLQVEDLSKHELFAEFNKKTIDMIVSEARRLAVKEILPTQETSDREGCQFDKGKVTVPKEFHRLYQIMREGEWIAVSDPPEMGGQGMPRSIAMAAGEYLNGANSAFMMFLGLTHGAGKLIETFGNEKQKALFLKKMYYGEWAGTMLLTEPQAGTDVGALTTTAVKNDDGTYSITGDKIFISAGEHDLTSNIIHPVLARIEGSPEGAAGISLFLVPKIWVNDDGTLGEFNDVVCTGIENKMGIHANPTCSLSLGGKGKCRGTLLGEANKGMRNMFLMMNEARLMVGLQGFSGASSSYMHAMNYAKERIQGKNLLQMKDKDAPSVPIIQHPDIRRVLLSMKAYVEGMRSLIYYIGLCGDKAEITDNAETQEKYNDIIELLTPIAKGYVTDRAWEVCSDGLQVFGGYGYVKDYPMEQLVRDCRISLIYEGTNGIQAMDLLGRKLGMKKGKPIMELLGEMQKSIAAAKNLEATLVLANRADAAISKLGEVAMHIGGMAMSAKVMTAFAFAYPFMDVCGDVVMAWMLLWRATSAATQLEKGAKKKDIAFYEGKIKSAEFFIHTILPVTLGKMNAIIESNGAAVEITDEAFVS